MISRDEVVDRRKGRQNSNQTAEHTRHDTMKSQVKDSNRVEKTPREPGTP